jgi:hypothetical protein
MPEGRVGAAVDVAMFWRVGAHLATFSHPEPPA